MKSFWLDCWCANYVQSFCVVYVYFYEITSSYHWPAYRDAGVSPQKLKHVFVHCTVRTIARQIYFSFISPVHHVNICWIHFPNNSNICFYYNSHYLKALGRKLFYHFCLRTPWSSYSSSLSELDYLAAVSVLCSCIYCLLQPFATVWCSLSLPCLMQPVATVCCTYRYCLLHLSLLSAAAFRYCLMQPFATVWCSLSLLSAAPIATVWCIWRFCLLYTLIEISIEN